AISTSDGTDKTDTVNVTTGTVKDLDKFTVSEQPGDKNKADYDTETVCKDGDTPIAKVDGGYTVPKGAGDIVCTIKNSRATSTVTVQKQWVNGVNGDEFTLNLGGEATGVTTPAAISTSDG